MIRLRLSLAPRSPQRSFNTLFCAACILGWFTFGWFALLTLVLYFYAMHWLTLPAGSRSCGASFIGSTRRCRR